MNATLLPRLLRVVIVVLLLGTVLAQLLIPVLGSDYGAMYPELDYLVVPYSVVGILAVVGIQAMLLVTWRLLSFVSGGTIFTARALRWVDALAVCASLTTVLALGVLGHLLFVVNVGGPGVLLAFVGTLAIGVAFVMLMLVMRGLLERAIAHSDELSEVI